MGKIKLVSMILVLSLCCSWVQGAADTHQLRIEGKDGWTKHIEIHEEATAFLVFLPTKEGTGVLIDRYPDGSEHNYSSYFLGYDRLAFPAKTPGRHVLSYIIDGQESNPVVIDVMGICSPAALITPLVVPEEVNLKPAIAYYPPITSVSLSRKVPDAPVVLHYQHIGSHIMNDRNGIVIPKYASQYYFGRDFSLGTIDGNYPGTPFLTQFLADP
jgi:hypothetical protein